MLKFKLLGINETFVVLNRKLKKESKAHLAGRSIVLLGALKDATPKDTGEASESWHMRVTSDSVEIVTDCEYMPALNEGHSEQADPHFIERTALKFGKAVGPVIKG